MKVCMIGRVVRSEARSCTVEVGEDGAFLVKGRVHFTVVYPDGHASPVEVEAATTASLDELESLGPCTLVSFAATAPAKCVELGPGGRELRIDLELEPCEAGAPAKIPGLVEAGFSGFSSGLVYRVVVEEEEGRRYTLYPSVPSRCAVDGGHALAWLSRETLRMLERARGVAERFNVSRVAVGWPGLPRPSRHTFYGAAAAVVIRAGRLAWSAIVEFRVLGRVYTVVGKRGLTITRLWLSEGTLSSIAWNAAAKLPTAQIRADVERVAARLAALSGDS